MVDLNKLLEDLTKEQIIDILYALGADRIIENEDYLITNTICHNEDAAEGSMKLYYYFNNRKFVCYTECNSSFNIFELVNKRFQLMGKNRVASKDEKKDENDFTFYDIIKFILDTSKIEFLQTTGVKRYKSISKRYDKKETPILFKFSDNVMNSFSTYYPIEWTREGITKKSMDRYNIKFSISRNKIIIPHYDIDKNLIGIRGRALNEEEAEEFGKYRPIEIEGISYAHPLSLNLYGLDISAAAIRKSHKVIIAEGEKSALLGYEYFGEDNIVVASCGSHINKNQINLLIRNFNIDEIIVAFDKEYQNTVELANYFARYKEALSKYKNYANFSIIVDRNNYLDYKDSPLDRGKEIFEKLLKERIKI